jgi:hypothetical protein
MVDSSNDEVISEKIQYPKRPLKIDPNFLEP